jgi:hypothetical protein
MKDACAVFFQGCDRSLLPALWLATGFQLGSTIVAYAPPNPIELRQYQSIKQRFEERLGRPINIRILHNGEDIFTLFLRDPKAYERLCRHYCTSKTEFPDDYHVQELKRHMDAITRDATRSLVFPFETKEMHREQLSGYAHLVLPDVPTEDKAEHNFLLRKHGFTDLPRMLVSFVKGPSSLRFIERRRRFISSFADGVHRWNRGR